MKTRNNIVAGVATALMLFLILSSAQLVAADKKRAPKGSEGNLRVALPMDRVTIEKKTLSEVITNAGREYTLSDGTIIMGLDGQQVSIRKMLVPCDAEITYISRANVREAQRIQIKSVYPNARWQWTAKESE